MALGYLYPVPENPPDEGDFIIVGFNVEWLPYVLGVLFQLQDPKIWDNPPEDIADQIATLMVLLQTDLDP